VILSPRLAQPFYNHDRIIRALPTVCRQVPEALLVLSEQFADQDYVAGLRRLAADLGVAERVLFVGAIPYQDMPLWMNLAEAVVMVPRSDGMPNTLLEAMACGAVPVLGRLPQYAEVIRHGVNGFLVEPEPSGIAEGLVLALSGTVDRAAIAERNRRFVMEAADQDQEMARMEGWYAELAKVGAARSPVAVAR
jgi:glycosyltransferase involved in cell wall biosynthesis